MTPIRYIRKVVFDLNQAEFAAAIGRTQASISRWENGVPFTVDDMIAIRTEALGRGMNWSDEWFFTVPSEPKRPATLDHHNIAALRLPSQEAAE